jgi:hypothetical protein
LTVYYSRPVLPHGCFKRDALLFKTVAVAHLAWLTYSGFEWSALHLLGLGFVAVGSVLTMAATAALGMDLTYFGRELGVVPPSVFVARWPYNGVAHPMIVGQLIALAGLWFQPVLRGAQWWWLVPTHAALYLVHLLQEEFDVHVRPAKARVD